jgi:hypothetical protein
MNSIRCSSRFSYVCALYTVSDVPDYSENLVSVLAALSTSSEILQYV